MFVTNESLGEIAVKKLSIYSFFLLLALSCVLFLFKQTSIVLFLWATYGLLLSISVFFYSYQTPRPSDKSEK